MHLASESPLNIGDYLELRHFLTIWSGNQAFNFFLCIYLLASKLQSNPDQLVNIF